MLNNLNIYKTQQVLVFSPAGTFLSTWPDAPLLAGFKETINSATSPLRISLPRTFDNFDQAGAPGSKGTVAQGNIVQFWLYGPGLPSSGKLRFQGIIDSYEPQINDKGSETVALTITPFDSILGDHGVSTDAGVTFGTAGNSATYVDPLTMALWFFNNNDALTGVPYMSPLTWNASNPSSSGFTTMYWFTKETMLDAMTSVITLLPGNWFFRTNPNKSFTIGQTPTSAQHIFYIGQHISNPSYKQDWTQLRNVVALKAGTLPNTTTQIYAVVYGSDIATFGERLSLESETRITDQNTANALADGYLNQLDRVALRAKVRIPDYRGSLVQSGLGYDIESIEVGDTVQIIDLLSTQTSGNNMSIWDQSVWDNTYWDYSPGAALNQLVQVQSLDYGFDYVDLELGLLQPSQDRNVFLISQSLQKYTVF